MRSILFAALLVAASATSGSADVRGLSSLSWNPATDAGDLRPASTGRHPALKGEQADLVWIPPRAAPAATWSASTIDQTHGCFQCWDGHPLANCTVTLDYYDSAGLVATGTVTTDANGCFTIGINCANSNQINEHWVVSSTCCKTAITVPTDKCWGDLGTFVCDDCDDCVNPPPNMTGWWQLDETTGGIAQDVAGGNACAWVGAPVPVLGQRVTNSTSLATANDYMNAASPNANVNVGTGNFSIDAWVKGTDEFTAVRTIVDHRQVTPGTTQYRGYSLFVYLGHLGLQMADGTGGTTFTNFVSSGPNIWDGAWHHVAATVFRPSSTGGTLYVDGAPIYTFDPTLRPNSLDNGGPFRIGMDFANASLPFAGDIDEVELFKSTLSAQEINAIYTAGADGKCKEYCSLLWDVSLWTGQSSVTTNLTICNYNATLQTYNWSMAGQPQALPNCTVNGPTTFTPAGGTVTVAPGACMQIPVAITNPGGMVPGDVACYVATVINTGTSHAMHCHGSISASGPGTCASGPRPWATVDVGGVVTATFVLINMSNDPTTYPIKVESMPMDMSPEAVVSLNGLPPGVPWTEFFDVPPHDSVTIAVPCQWLSPDAFMTHSVIFSVDVTGTGVLQPVASENLSQEHPQLASIDPGEGPGRPLGLSLGPVPFSRSVEVRFALSAAGEAAVDILDVTGRLLRTLTADARGAGDYHLTWDGRRSDGRDTGPGLYVFRLRQGRTMLTAKAIRVP